MLETEKKVFYRIKNIDYQALDEEIPKNDLFVTFYDQIENIRLLKEDKLFFDIRRVVEFEPKVLFKLSVSFEIKIEFERTPSQILDEKEVIANASEIIGDSLVFSNLVTLIANITSVQGNAPIITSTELNLLVD